MLFYSYRLDSIHICTFDHAPSWCEFSGDQQWGIFHRNEHTCTCPTVHDFPTHVPTISFYFSNTFHIPGTWTVPCSNANESACRENSLRASVWNYNKSGSLRILLCVRLGRDLSGCETSHSPFRKVCTRIFSCQSSSAPESFARRCAAFPCANGPWNRSLNLWHSGNPFLLQSKILWRDDEFCFQFPNH